QGSWHRPAADRLGHRYRVAGYLVRGRSAPAAAGDRAHPALSERYHSVPARRAGVRSAVVAATSVYLCPDLAGYCPVHQRWPAAPATQESGNTSGLAGWCVAGPFRVRRTTVRRGRYNRTSDCSYQSLRSGMKNRLRMFLAGVPFVLLSSAALADDIEGQVESINKGNQTFVVQGITFFANESTDYDDGLKDFNSLQVGQKVEVDFDYRDGRHYATEIELED